MLKNNIRAFAVHVVLTLLIGIIYIKTRLVCVDSSTAKLWIHLGLFLLTAVLYILSGFYIMKPCGGKLKNLLSLVLPVITGLIIYFMDTFVFGYLYTDYKGVLYLVYNILFTPVIEVISTFMDYKYVWIVFAAIPSLLMWAGLQLKVHREGMNNE